VALKTRRLLGRRIPLRAICCVYLGFRGLLAALTNKIIRHLTLGNVPAALRAF
jgi:hypothetical protein